MISRSLTSGILFFSEFPSSFAAWRPLMRLTRRRFLESSLAAAATITVAGTKSSGKVLGANDTVRIGIAGLNGRGGEHVGQFLGKKNVEIACLIDPDTRTYKGRLKTIADKNGGVPVCVQDV